MHILIVGRSRRKRQSVSSHVQLAPFICINSLSSDVDICQLSRYIPVVHRLQMYSTLYVSFK